MITDYSFPHTKQKQLFHSGMSIITASPLPLSNTALKHITSVLPNEGKNDHLPWLERTNKWGCVDKISNFISFYERTDEFNEKRHML